MTVTVKNIIPRKQAEIVQTVQYFASGCKTIIDRFTATNTSALNAQLSVNLVANGASASDSNLVADSITMKPGETYTFPELIGQVIEPSGSISTISSEADSLTISASGREIT